MASELALTDAQRFAKVYTVCADFLADNPGAEEEALAVFQAILNLSYKSCQISEEAEAKCSEGAKPGDVFRDLASDECEGGG